MSEIEALIAAALAVRGHAYAPYSRFPVGAAIRAEDGRIYLGVNVENASYPEGLCAEAAALGAMVAGGARRIRAIAIVAGGAEPCPPCGGCRQRLAEFAAPHTELHLCTDQGARRVARLSDLFPEAFASRHLPG